MNTIITNGKSIIVNKDTITVDNKTYQIPNHVKSRFGTSNEMINGRIYLNGYRFNEKTGEWSISYKKIKTLFKVLIWAIGIGAAFWLIYFISNHVQIV